MYIVFHFAICKQYFNQPQLNIAAGTDRLATMDVMDGTSKCEH
jgi:hypothetical protein